MADNKEISAKRPFKKLIVGNWKMNPEYLKDAANILGKIKKAASTKRKVDTVICPPHAFLGDLRKYATGKRLTLGGQDCYFESAGSYTGETSPLQLKSLKAKYVIIGHSERRAAGETDEIIAKKVKAGIQSGLHVILCIGEKKRDKDGLYMQDIKKQLFTNLGKISKADFDRLVIAYEPIWAIGENARRAAKPADIFEMKIFIRRVLTDKFGKISPGAPFFLYGGSADDKNARDFLEAGQADGLLVGRASRDPEVFERILKIGEELS